MSAPATLTATGNIKGSPGKLRSLSLSAGIDDASIDVVNSTDSTTPVVFNNITAKAGDTVSLALPPGGVWFETGIRIVVVSGTTPAINATYD